MLSCMSERRKLFVADWIDAIFVHFAIDPHKLQPIVPLELDCLDGQAYVSLVAFTQRNLRPCVGRALAAPLQDDFLLERYTAFTYRAGIVRRFDVEHAPWPHERVEIDLPDTTLLPRSGDWFRHARLVAAHHSPGVCDVSISAPRRVAI